MTDLLFQTIKESRLCCLNALRTTQIILSQKRECLSLKLIGCSPYSQLLSNHKETDKKAIADMMEAL